MVKGKIVKNKIGKATVLAIGTELTTGQITNRNAAWISEKLVNMGIEVIFHLTVPDDRPLILEALEDCAEKSQFIFVTGGLGPTSDDFTREVIGQWVNQPMEYHPTVWDAIVKRLSLFGIPIAESNRQQCYFPKGSRVLSNPEGTAAGFCVPLPENKSIWVFPGPPREIAAIWKNESNEISKTLVASVPNLETIKLFTWECLGKSEAELGEMTEKALLGSGLTTGYRAHLPFVEIKVWCPETKISQNQHWLTQLQTAIQPWVVTTQGEDLAEKLLQYLQNHESIEILDSATGGILTHRLGLLLRESRYTEWAKNCILATEWDFPASPEGWVADVLEKADAQLVTLALGGFTPDGLGAVGIRIEDKVFQAPLQSPYRKVELRERTRHFAIEIALKQWADWLNMNTH
jgi:nicotinamide-nucleotide amidase